MKIVITGGLGYIGTELCKLYSGEARYKEIIVIDNRFISERVTQLRKWGIKFIQCNLFDDDILKQILRDTDIVIHLAGITDVAYTKTESDDEKDKEIKRVGIDGTRNILKFMNNNCKIIFPSTHVIYEGFSETMQDIEEYTQPCPVLTYSKGKVQSEYDIIESGKNFVILRLGSVYGFSGDTMRINIMPNLFAKIASQNGTIKLFSGGVQLKSLAPLIDVARCFKFMAENKNINRETYHVSKENLTVKDVALLCKEINTSLNIEETDDEIPNLGYTISNKKLLSTGFEFRYNLKECLEEMISNWSHKEPVEDLEYIINGTDNYIDERGIISNYELTEPINLIGYIESKAGSVRANHYHPIQEQKCLLIRGSYISVIKDLSVENSIVETKLIKAGDIAVIQPNVAHTMVFLEDSVFLNLVRGEREHQNYGVTHTIPYILVDEDFRVKLLNGFKSKCRSCGLSNMKKVISLGRSPLANNLLNSIVDCDRYPLEVDYCPSCHNSQLNYVVPAGEMFDNYLYVSSTAESFRKHFEKAASDYIDLFNLNDESFVVDIGSNDGVFLKPLKDKGIRVLGVEPALNISEIANKNGIETLNSYFNSNIVDVILSKYGKADIVTASNVFAHSDDLVNITKEAFRLLKDGGHFIIEVQYFLDTIKDLTFDNIYHEHVNYWTVTSLNNFFNNLGFNVNKVEHIDTHGGSIRVFIDKNSSIDSSVIDYIAKEIDFGILNYQTYTDFNKKVLKIRDNINLNIRDLKSKYDSIAAYGSPAKATTALNFYGIDNSFIDFTIEDNNLKNGKFIPGVNIPIRNKEWCNNNLPNIIIVLAWNFYEEIKNNNQDLLDKGVKFISIKDLEKENFSI